MCSGMYINLSSSKGSYLVATIAKAIFHTVAMSYDPLGWAGQNDKMIK